jgi:hypothetical protein
VFVEKRDDKGAPVRGPHGEIIFIRRDVAIDEEEDGDYVPIKSGLERGERIVISGGIQLLGLI